MIKAILIDDEEGAIKSLQSMLKKYCPQVSIIGLADNIIEGQKLIESLNPELLFLDINMPNGTGLDLMDRISHIDIGVIFTTAYQEYAINAVRLSAVDYLLKPIDSNELKQAINRFENRTKSFSENISLLKELINSPQKLERLAISDMEGIQIVKRSDISYIEASRNYSIFYLSNATQIVSSKPLGEYERILTGHGFIRAHRSYLVNMEHVLKFDKKEGSLILKNNHEVEVSRNKREEIISELNKSA